MADAVRVLYSDHHRWLNGWLRKKLGCTNNAADLAQDTFVRLMSSGTQASDLREPRAYLTTIANGLVVNYWRRQAIEKSYLEALALKPMAVAPSPEERRMILETLEEIARLLDGLPKQVREAFLLSQLEGLTYPQIAAKMGITVNIVQKAMTRAVSHCYRTLFS